MHTTSRLYQDYTDPIIVPDLEEFGLGRARLGLAGRGVARQGKARQGNHLTKEELNEYCLWQNNYQKMLHRRNHSDNVRQVSRRQQDGTCSGSEDVFREGHKQVGDTVDQFDEFFVCREYKKRS
jgi:hypothetical protein